jgi:hypothetical protein
MFFVGWRGRFFPLECGVVARSRLSRPCRPMAAASCLSVSFTHASSVVEGSGLHVVAAARRYRAKAFVSSCEGLRVELRKPSCGGGGVFLLRCGRLVLVVLLRASSGGVVGGVASVGVLVMLGGVPARTEVGGGDRWFGAGKGGWCCRGVLSLCNKIWHGAGSKGVGMIFSWKIVGE